MHSCQVDEEEGSDAVEAADVSSVAPRRGLLAFVRCRWLMQLPLVEAVLSSLLL